MATNLKNLSFYNSEDIPNARQMRIGIVVSEWNESITNALLEGAVKTLRKHGVVEENIILLHVPGSFELTFGSRVLAEKEELDAVICLGCIIRGETRHFDYISQGVTHGITELNLDYEIPFVFGVLTTDNQEQATDRAGGKHGNKGDEAAITAIKMVALKRKSSGIN